MNSFVFNSFKQRFLNGQAPSAFNANFIPMNNKFIDNFSQSGFSIEQFRTVDDLKGFKNEVGETNTLYEDSKLQYEGILYTWYKPLDTTEQVKPMYINKENYDEFKESDYWSLCSANKHIEKYSDSGFYLLRTKEELNWFANSVNEGNNGIIGVLTDDVDGKINSFIGKDETIPFQGILDGNGFALRNPTVICSAVDNGLVPVLGSKGTVRNFRIVNDERKYMPVLKGLKQINLEYLKKEASDINCGVLVGKNYGTIENVKLGGQLGADKQSFYFDTINFVPQVYSVSNKSDEISNFTDVRKKFDNGENFYFLNSWCINSPGNICPYVGYFAEGIFAQQAGGFDDFNNAPANIEFRPKLKSYYDTGTESIDLDFSDAESEDAPKLTLLAIYMKYDWAKDYLSDDSVNDITSYKYRNNLDYVIENDVMKEGEPQLQQEHHHIIFDNVAYRSTDIVEGSSVKYGMTKEEIKILKSDPTWLSFNDDPRGRNAVAIVKCEYKNKDKVTKTCFLEMNGVYLANGSLVGFALGSLDLSVLPPPVSDPSLEDLYSWPFEDKDPKESYRMTFGYELCLEQGEIGSNFLLKRLRFDSNNTTIYDEPYSDEAGTPASFDITDSIRAFDENGHPITIKTFNSFSYSFVLGNVSSAVYSTNTNKYILTNVVFNTDAELCTYTHGGETYSIKFASKLLGPINIKSGEYNNTHNTVDDNRCQYNMSIGSEYGASAHQLPASNFNDKFVLRNGENKNETHLLINDLYTLDRNMFPCSFDYTSDPVRYPNRPAWAYYLHANDYKQFIASTYYGLYNGKLKKLLQALVKNSSSLTSEDRALFNTCFEFVEENSGKHRPFSYFTDEQLDNQNVRATIYKNLTNNYNTYFKNEIDYTNVAYVSQVESNGKLKNVYKDHCISRQFLPVAMADGNNWNEFRTYMLGRNSLYVNFMPNMYDYDIFYSRINLNESDVLLGIPNYQVLQIIDGGDYVLPTTAQVETGSITIETFNYTNFIYSPFVSCSKDRSINLSEHNIHIGDDFIFDAGAPYSVLTINGDAPEYLQKAAEMYAKNPNYYGLDYQGNWTSMAVRTSGALGEWQNLGTMNCNQINFNWNIIKKMYEDIYNDNEKKEPDDLLWNGIYYDKYIYPEYDGTTAGKITWKYYNKDGEDPSNYYDQYTLESCIPKSLLNKPLRMHNMVRAAYNVSPIVGANYGTITSAVGRVSVVSHDNFVGFMGTVAGKNANGKINNIRFSLTYDFEPVVEYVKYKNTPILPYEITKTIHIPDDPAFAGNYSIYPPELEYFSNGIAAESEYHDICETVNCISYYDENTKTSNPQYIADKSWYNEIKDFRFFTSAWYDDTEQKITDDVISYQLKPVYVLGGLVGRVVASKATSADSQYAMTTDIDTVSIKFFGTRNDRPWEYENADIHSNFGTLIGQVDIQTTDTNRTNVNNLVNIKTVEIGGMKNESTIGYVEYQPIDLNTVVATYDYPRGAGDDYGLKSQHVTYAIDMPIIFDMNRSVSYLYNTTGMHSLIPPRWATINQSSGAFINAEGLYYTDDNSIDTYCTHIFNEAIKLDGVSAQRTYSDSNYYKFDIPSIYNGPNGLVSINSVFGSNTIFEPMYKQTRDERKCPIYYNNAAGGVAPDHMQEELKYPEYTTRFYYRGLHSYESHLASYWHLGDVNAPYNDRYVMNKSSDSFFNYTYNSAHMTNVDTVSANMFTNIPVMWDNINLQYVADFTDQDGATGDNVNYSEHNVLSFGRSMSPMYIRSRINENTTFTSVLFSAYEISGTERVEASHDNQLGGFLVYDTTPKQNLMMFISNDNGAVIDGRSYNLEFPINYTTVTAKDEYGNVIVDDNGNPVTSAVSQGGVILNVSANNTDVGEALR